MQATERLWRTADNRLVRDGDEAATELAYTPGDEIAPKDESLVPGDEQDGEKSDGKAEVKAADEPTSKQAPRSADKAAPKPDNK